MTTKDGTAMIFTIEFEREVDGRWIAEVLELPGVMVYGDSKDDAIEKAKALTLDVLAESIRHGETVGLQDIKFVAAA
ncbi:MAG: type II toxin-antitoxin system HicB family antitoxin [Syntrophobacteraceae bacterium]